MNDKQVIKTILEKESRTQQMLADALNCSIQNLNGKLNREQTYSDGANLDLQFL